MSFSKFGSNLGDLFKAAFAKKEADNKVSNSRFQPKVAGGQLNNDSPVIVGLDFGTSFTKAYCNIAGRNEPVQFDVDGEQSFFLPSVVYFDKAHNSLCIKKNADLECVRYFKYTMVNDELKQPHEDVKGVAFDVLCSVFFLANVMKWIKDLAARRSPGKRMKFFFHMGCPIANEDGREGSKNKGVFNRVLNAAYVLSEQPNLELMDLDRIAEFYKANSDKRSGFLRTIPELYAEALWFIDKSTSGAGVYAILDIGGGTVDYATIAISFVDGVKKTDIYSQGAKPLGVEILLKKFYPHDYEENRDNRLDELKRSCINIPSHGKDNPLQDPQHIYGNAFEILFFQGVMDVKDISPKLMKRQKDIEGQIPYYTFGGGAGVNWYHSIIDQHNDFIGAAGIPRLNRKNVRTELPDNRLLIAYPLSQSSLPDVGKYPWEFKRSERQLFSSEIPSYLLMDD